MKQPYLLLVLAIIFTACQKDEPSGIPQSSEISSLGQSRGALTRREMVALDNLCAALRGLSAPNPRPYEVDDRIERTVSEIIPVTIPAQPTGPVKLSVPNGSDTVLFVAAFTESKGYAILSAVDYLEPVLSVIDNGSYSTAKLQTMLIEKLNGTYNSNTLQNPGYPKKAQPHDPHQGYLIEDIITDYVISKRDSMLTASNVGSRICASQAGEATVTDVKVVPYVTGEEKGEWQTVLKYAPMNTAHYNQNHPYNSHTPMVDGQHTLAGCGAVGLTMLLEYWKYPEYIDLSPLKDMMYLLDWETIHTVATHENGYSLGTAEAQDKVAWMMYYIGFCYLNSTYGVSATYTAQSKIKSALQRMNYKNVDYQQMLYSAYFMSDLSSGKPVLVSGWSKTSGHYWLIDGALLQQRPVYVVYSDGSRVPNYQETQILYHCNWGWGGSWNGYFLSNMFYYKKRQYTEPGYDSKPADANEDEYYFKGIIQITYSR